MTLEEWKATKQFQDHNDFFNEDDKIPQFVYADKAFIILDKEGIFSVYIESTEKNFERLSEAEQYLWFHHSQHNYTEFNYDSNQTN